MPPNFRTEFKLLWQLAWPILIGQVATVGMSVADIMMVGHYHKDDLAAVALGSSLWVIVMVTVIGIMVAINAVIAYEVGSKNFKNIPHIMRQSMWMSFGVGCISCLILNYSTIVFNYLEIDEVIHNKATQFVYVISIGMPALAMYRALYSYSTSLNQTIPVMVVSVVALVFNIMINWLLIYGNFGFPELGATGCALASAFGMWFMLGIMIWWVRYSKVYKETYPFSQYENPNWNKIKYMLRIGIPIGITYFIEVSAFCVVGLLIARFGVVQVSANQIALNSSSLLFMVPMSIGMALITRVGQSLGEKNTEKARYVSWLGIFFSLTFSTFSATLIFFFRDSIACAYTSDPEVQTMTSSLLLISAIFQFSDGVQVIASSALRGYKETVRPMLIHLMAFYFFALPLGYALAIAPNWLPWRPEKPMGVTGFWMGLTLGLTISAVLQVGYLQIYSKRMLGENKN